MKYLSAARDVAAIALLIVLTVLLWDARAGLQATTSDLATTQQQLRATLLDVSRFTQDATGVTAALRHTLKASEQSDELVAANSAAATKQAAATLASLDDLVRHTDAQINSQVLPQLATAIHDQNANLTAVSQRLNASLEQLAVDEKDLQPILANSAQASAAAAKLTADPAIPDALKNLDQASAGMAATAKNAADASHDLAEAIHRETRPVSFTVKVASWIVNNAAKAGSVLAGFVK